MRILKMVLYIGLTFFSAFSQENNEESKVRIGILNLETYGDATKEGSSIDAELAGNLKDVGFYDIYNQEKLTEILKQIKSRIPVHCRDPRCVLDIGSASAMNRMIYGSIEINDNRCGINIELIDVNMRQTIESVKILGDPGVKATEIIKIAVAKLHGHTPEGVKTSIYHGPKIHNEKQFLLTSASWVGAGLLWGIISYVVENDNVNKIKPECITEYSNEKLSGHPASACQIPLFARPAALANAYVAQSDDAYGVLYNPAGMAWVPGPEMVAGYQYRFGLSNIGVSYVNRATREIGFGQAFLYSGDAEGLMTEMYFVTAVAYKFIMLSNNLIRPFSLGVNLKLVSNKVKGTTENSVSGNSFGAGIDLGFLWELSEFIRYGLLFRDLPVVNKWKNVSTGKEYYETHASTLHMGGTFKVGYTTMLIAEGQLPIYEDQLWKMSGALEQELFRIFVFRIGLQKQIQSLIDTPWKITGGFGLKINTESLFGKHMMIDGSYEYNTLEVFDVINCSVRFGF